LTTLNGYLTETTRFMAQVFNVGLKNKQMGKEANQ
jgi:hypothetical protein